MYAMSISAKILVVIDTCTLMSLMFNQNSNSNNIKNSDKLMSNLM